jgi:hypothetical protein
LSTKIFYFSGPCKWAKLSTPDEYNGQESYKINVYLNKADLRTLDEAGSKIKVKEDDDGKYVTFSRKKVQEIAGDLKDMGPPMVIDTNKESFTADIGNGSDVTCKVSIYDTRMGKGTRLEAVRVDNHVVYDPEAAQGEF